MASPQPAVGAVVVDFDGTVVDRDVSEEILAAFATPGWWDVDLEFQRGEIGSRECLTRQASMLRGSASDMLAFALERHHVDATFPPFVRWARARGMTVAVASDGLGFYIEPMLRAAGVGDVVIHANTFSIDFRSGVVLSFPEEHPKCRTCGVCKMSIVERYRAAHGLVAFVGEGHTDRYGAIYADVVFAKKHLTAICESGRVPYVEWASFDDVSKTLENLRHPSRRVTPERCPGWADSAGPFRLTSTVFRSTLDWL
jgi:2,3-diketo-5-methylthio-1-phosphopentane phosphatase